MLLVLYILVRLDFLVNCGRVDYLDVWFFNFDMRVLISILEIALPALYFATIWAYARSFFSGIKSAGMLKTPLLILTIAAHALYIGCRTATFSHPPITSLFEILSLIALTISIVYAYIELRTKN